MSQAINAKVLEYIESSGAALEAARKMAEASLARHEKVAALIPPQVSLLLQSKLVLPEEKQAAAEKLSSHDGALEVVGNLVRYVQKQAADHAKELAAKGPGVAMPATKAASVSSTESNYVGRRHGYDDKPESWKVLEQRLGLG